MALSYKAHCPKYPMMNVSKKLHSILFFTSSSAGDHYIKDFWNVCNFPVIILAIDYID